MCSSRYAAAFASCDRAASALVELDPVLAQRVRQRDPVPVVQLPQLVLVASSSPAAADEPNSERPKRAPSSSAHETSRTVTGGCPSAAIRRSTSTPASTFRQPSSQPPFGTESMCPPISSALSDAPREREPLVAGLVDLLDGARSRDLRAQELARRLPRVRPRDALRAVLVAGQRAQLLELGDGACGVERHLARKPNRVIRPPPMSKRVRALANGTSRRSPLVVALMALWELYRWIWTSAGWTWPFVVDNTSMPHVWTIFKAFGQPAQVNQPALITILFHKALFTAKEVGGRLRARRGGRLRARHRPRPLAPAAARLPAVHRREPDDADPGDRADGRRLGQPEAAGRACRAGAPSR